MISAHDITFTINGNPYHVKSAEVTLDESWAPYAQATLVLSPPPADDRLGNLDPRAAQRGIITLTERFGTGINPPNPTVAFFTQLYGRLRVAAITSTVAGGRIAKLTARLTPTPWNSYGNRPAVTRTFNLGIRERTIDYGTGEIEVKLASDEALLQDYARSTPAGYVSPSVVNIANILLNETIGATTQATSDTFYPVGDDARFWEVGGYAWDFLIGVVTVARARLWCDEMRIWHLRAMPLDQAATGTVNLSHATNITTATDTISADGEYALGVIVRYHWADADGNDQTRYDISNLITWTPGMKTAVVDIEGQYPGAGAANQILRRRLGRGQIVALTALSDYKTTPGMRAYITPPNGRRLVGAVAAVTWNYPDDEMTVTTRELAEG